MRQSVLRVDADRRFVGLQRVAEASDLIECDTPVIVDVSAFAIDLQSPFVLRQRFVVLSEPRMDQSTLVVQVIGVQAQLQGLVESGKRPLVVAELREDDAAAELEVRASGL
jgi:hypothetical protein